MKQEVIGAREVARFLGMSYETFDAYRDQDLRDGTPGATVPPGFRFTPKGHWRYTIESVRAWLANRATSNLASASASVGESAHT